MVVVDFKKVLPRGLQPVPLNARGDLRCEISEVVNALPDLGIIEIVYVVVSQQKVLSVELID